MQSTVSVGLHCSLALHPTASYFSYVAPQHTLREVYENGTPSVKLVVATLPLQVLQHLPASVADIGASVIPSAMAFWTLLYGQFGVSASFFCHFLCYGYIYLCTALKTPLLDFHTCYSSLPKILAGIRCRTCN